MIAIQKDKSPRSLRSLLPWAAWQDNKFPLFRRVELLKKSKAQMEEVVRHFSALTRDQAERMYVLIQNPKLGRPKSPHYILQEMEQAAAKHGLQIVYAQEDPFPSIYAEVLQQTFARVKAQCEKAGRPDLYAKLSRKEVEESARQLAEQLAKTN